METPEPQTPQQQEQEDFEAVAARVKRRLLMGAALVLALVSIYGGMLGAPRLLQVGIAAIAAACVFLAFRTAR